VSPAFSFAPANLVIHASVEPDAENRSMEVVADSEEFYRSSTITLEGDRAPKTTMVEFRTLPPGEYEVTVSLIGADGHRRGSAQAHVNVLESGAAR
jgi:methionine-rich copper-binding protein CopC